MTMARTVSRGVPDKVTQAAHLYLNARHDEAAAKKAKGTKDKGSYGFLYAWCLEHGEEDQRGNRTWTFREPIIAGGATYTGITLQARQGSSYFDEDAAKKLIDSLGPEVVEAATRTEIIYDLDYLFVLRQQDQVTSEQLDEILITPDAVYALTVDEAP
jgi:hypothetical protein